MPAFTLRYPDTSFWHLLFPLGGSEQVTRPGGGAGAVSVQEFDDAFLDRLVGSFAEYMRQSGKMGAQPQPRPVSVDHSIVSALLGKETEVDPRRVGEVCALHFLREGRDGAPAGVYGLIQWRHFEFCDIDGRPYLSPTTKAQQTMRDGTRIPGPFLFEVGLVSLPALDTIGSVYERLALSALPLPEYARLPVAGDDPSEPMTLRVATYSPGLIMRGATYAEEPPVDMSPEMIAKLDEMIGEKIAAAIDEMEERMYKRMEERMAAPSAPPEPASEPSTDPVEEPLEARSLRIATEMFDAEAIELIKARKLLHRDVSEFITRRLEGAGDELIKDYAQLAKPQGFSGSVPEPTGAPKSIKLDDIMIEAAIGVAKGGDIKSKFNELRNDYVTRGYTLEA